MALILKNMKTNLVYLMSVDKARFRNPIFPDCELHLDIEAVRSHMVVFGNIKVIAKVNGKKNGQMLNGQLP